MVAVLVILGAHVPFDVRPSLRSLSLSFANSLRLKLLSEQQCRPLAMRLEEQQVEMRKCVWVVIG